MYSTWRWRWGPLKVLIRLREDSHRARIARFCALVGIDRTRSIIVFAFDHVPQSAQSLGLGLGASAVHVRSRVTHVYVLAFLVLALKKIEKGAFV